MAKAEGVWRTVGGRRIFIGEGEDLATAMKKSGKFKNKKKDDDEDELKRKYLDIPQDERAKAYEEGKNWKDLVREKEEKTKVNESNVRKLFDKEKEYKFNDNVKNEIEWKEKNKEILEKGYKEETGTDPYKNGKEKTSFEDYQTWRYGLEYKKVHKK